MGKKITNEEFIKRAKEKHGDKYDYSKVEFKNTRTKVCIICPEHGEFWQEPSNHFNGQGCPVCRYIKSGKIQLKSKEKFIEDARKIHGDKYDYSKVEYNGNKKKVCIICSEHGEFWQTPHNHITHKRGCPKCKGGVKYTQEEFIELAKLVHGDKYDYSKVEYINANTKVCIICPKDGEFWQKPVLHLNGAGCPKCNQSHLEREIKIFLTANGYEFEEQKKFDWLVYKDKLKIDVYLPKQKIAIECQGKQHYDEKSYFNKNEKDFLSTQIRDKIKQKLCEEHGIKVIYYGDKEYENNILTDLNDIKTIINNY